MDKDDLSINLFLLWCSITVKMKQSYTMRYFWCFFKVHHFYIDSLTTCTFILDLNIKFCILILNIPFLCYSFTLLSLWLKQTEIVIALFVNMNGFTVIPIKVNFDSYLPFKKIIILKFISNQYYREKIILRL